LYSWRIGWSQAEGSGKTREVLVFDNTIPESETGRGVEIFNTQHVFLQSV